MKSQTQKFQFSSGSIKYLKANRCEAYPSGMPNTETELEKKKKTPKTLNNTHQSQGGHYL